MYPAASFKHGDNTGLDPQQLTLAQAVDLSAAKDVPGTFRASVTRWVFCSQYCLCSLQGLIRASVLVHQVVLAETGLAGFSSDIRFHAQGISTSVCTNAEDCWLLEASWREAAAW